MIVTEEMLAPYRKDGGPISIDGISQSLLRDRGTNLFTPTDVAFRSDWANHRNAGIAGISREKLEIILVLAFTRSVPVLRPDREWVALYHQCGGDSCECETMIATRLTPRISVLSTLQLIAREGFYAETGHFDRGQRLASRIVNYVATLARIGLDCESTWPYLTESLYPVDATQDNLNRVAEDAPDLDRLADGKRFVRARYAINPVIFFMTENSD
jgi:hypothetical protein